MLVWGSFALHLAIVLRPVIVLHLATGLHLAIALHPVIVRTVRTGSHPKSKSRGRAPGTKTRLLYLLSEVSLKMSRQGLAENEGALFRTYDHPHHPQMHLVSLRLNNSARRPLPATREGRW